MATPQQLAPYGQINPQSKPVSAFIEPNAQITMGQPTQPSLFSAPKGIQTVGTATTGMVQGYNPYQRLAQDLQPFSEQLVKAVQSGGLAFASWQMDQGEQAAMEQVAEATTRLDEEIETSELNRAAANRSLAIRDPQAGGIMNLLNPYRAIGYQRGMSKRAGQEISEGMAGYVSRNSDRIDYLAPDQGFAALQSIRAEYTNQVLDKYGVDSASPGFTKYTAPKIEKASDAVAEAIQKDRADWIDSQKPKTTAALLLSVWNDAIDNGVVTFEGTTYRRNDPGFDGAVKARLNQVATAELMTGGLPGQITKWEKETYKILAATKYFSDGGISPLDYLQSSTPVLDAEGKQVVDNLGRPKFFTWNELYAKESIDAEIKYDQAQWASNNRARKDYAAQVTALVAEATMGMRPGAAREAVIAETVNKFMQNLEKNLGGPVDSVTRSFIYEAARKGNDLSYESVVMADDPRVVTDFVNSIAGGTGPFNGAQARNELNQLINSLNDPKLAGQLQTQGLAAIDEREKSEDVNTRFGATFNPIIDRRVQLQIDTEYRQQTAKSKRLALAAEERLRAVYEPAVQDAIRAEELEKERRLTQTEAAKVTRDTLDGIKPDQLEGVFKGGRTEKDNEKNKSNNTSGSAQTTSSTPTPIAPTYTNQGLASIPNRRVVLRQYQTVRFMDSSAIAEAVTNAYLSYDQPKALMRAYRDSGAKSLYDFVNAQYELLKQQVPDYEPAWTEQQWLRFKSRSQRISSLERGAFSTANLVQSRPMLASIQGSMVSIPFEV